MLFSFQYGAHINNKITLFKTINIVRHLTTLSPALKLELGSTRRHKYMKSLSMHPSKCRWTQTQQLFYAPKNKKKMQIWNMANFHWWYWIWYKYMTDLKSDVPYPRSTSLNQRRSYNSFVFKQKKKGQFLQQNIKVRVVI